MSVPRLAAALLAATALVASAGAASARSDAAPTGLHGFLLRADEPAQSAFPRTPAFAWQPVSGADHYEFELSTSSTFRDNAIIWTKDDLLSPVAAPEVSLPWITGSPHSLYARVRAVQTDGTVGPWSSDYGFDMVPPPAPSPLPSAPGLLRWTPVEGADGYEVWLLDAQKFESTFSNVLDEREFYTFHQTSTWTGTVRWRVRALRDDMLGRQNGVPVTEYGPWSSIYVSSNPAVTGGQIHLGQTISDVVSDGGPASSAHKLMPAFTWTGNQTLHGTPAELFRVYVFTDKQCLNRVYTSAVIGSPAYAPRPYGPLALPTTSSGVQAARSSYLVDGSEPGGTTFDGEPVTTSESAPQATPTTTLPAADTSGGGSSGSSGGSSGAGSSSSSSSSGSGGGSFLDWGDSKFGAPVDLWDTNWPSGGYYWTVVPVAAAAPGSLQTTIAPPGGIAGVTTLPVTSSTGFAPGDSVTVGNASNQETVTIVSVDASSITFSTGLKQGHGAGEPVVRTAGSIRYTDLELAQDVCAAGRVSRFGIASEPTLTGGGDAFASGLSPSGKLTSATHTAAFYRPPLVAWTPALRAEAYQVQWSKTAYPFVPEADPTTGSAGILTAATSYVLPLSTGTWYYRVRGYDYSLPTGSQQMSWSDPTKITIVPPTFAVVDGSTGAASTKTTKSTRVYDTGIFSLALPTSWKKLALKDTTVLFYAKAAKSIAGFRPALNVQAGSGRGSRTYASWAKDLAKQAKLIASGKVVAGVVTEPAGKTVALRYLVVSKRQKLAVYQWVFENGKQAYVLSCAVPASAAKTYVKVFARVARSFSFS